MATNNKDTSTAAQNKDAVQHTEKPKYRLEQLRKHSTELFGVSSSTWDGAFYGVEAKEITVDEARARLNKWLGKE